jgi:hypothetical protein
MQFINTHDLPGLQQEFAALPVPQRALLVRTLRGGLKIVKLAPLVGKWVDLDRVDRALGGVAKAKAVERAAYEWLKPESTRTRDTLADLQSEVGLQKLKPGAFADELRHACESFRKAAPRLTRHIDKRLAELTVLKADTAAYHIPQLEIYQRKTLDAGMRAAARDATGPANAMKALQEILPAIATKCREVLDPDHDKPGQPVFTNTNFMAIVDLAGTVGVPDIPSTLGAYREYPAAARAAKLWKDLDRTTKRVFVVITDTDNDRHRGFWIPDVMDNNCTIPGAPTAMSTRRPHAVFADDLPTLGIIDAPTTTDNWHSYMRDRTENGFRDDMFISLPIFARASQEGDHKPAGVVNVNCGAGSYWPRAYSSEWLRIAATAAAPLLSLAWHAFAIHHAALYDQKDLFRTNPFVYALPPNAPQAHLLQSEEVDEQPRQQP